MDEAVTVAEIAKAGLASVNGVLKLYKDTVDTAIPWEFFRQTIADLKNSEKEYSNAAAELVGKVQKHLLDSSDEYDSSLEEVNRWCKMVVPVLGQFMSLFEHTTNRDVAEAQKILLLQVLDDGADQIRKAISKLEASTKSFNDAQRLITTLTNQLDNDFKRGSSYYKAAVQKVRIQAYCGAVAGAAPFGAIGLAILVSAAPLVTLAFAPIALAISYIIATGVTEGYIIPKLEQAFNETKEMFEKLRKTVAEARASIESAKKSISQEIRVLGNVSAKIKETKSFATTWALAPSVLFGDLKQCTNELIDMCKQYTISAEKKIDEKYAK